MYLGPTCPNHPFSEGFGHAEINTQIQMVLAPGANLNLGAGPTPLSEGVDSTRLSPPGPILGYLCHLWFLNAFMLLRRVSSVHIVPLGASPCSWTWRGMETEKMGPLCHPVDGEGTRGGHPTEFETSEEDEVEDE
jgi:hypothetical protein